MAEENELSRSDSNESLISQFETTLTIKSTNNDYDDDVSMAHSTFYNHSYNHTATAAINEEDEDEDDTDDENQNHMVSFSKPASNLRVKGAFRVKKEDELRGLRGKKEDDFDDKEAKETRSRSNSIKSRSRSHSRSSNKSRSPTPESIRDEIKKYEKYLKPSPLIDESLTKYNKSFSEFLKSNPQIERESPKFVKETDKTLVVLSPFSAEHSFGRKWLGKSYLATIFERPQRLLASCIGIAAAVTMYPFFYKTINSTKRGSIFSPHVLKVHGKNWPKKLYELCLQSQEKLENKTLEVPEDWNTGDIYLVPKTINAIEGVIGTIETGIDSLYTLNYSLSFIVIRPPGHHSHACLPSGFCLLNNVQIGVEYAFDTYDVSHVAIVDIDLHHGDGSQDICWERAGFVGDFGKDEQEDVELGFEPRDEYGKRFARYPKVGYFSLHDIKSYPTELGYATRENIKNASTCIMDHDLNIWNVHLQEWETETEFYKHYQTKYVSILNRVNQFLHQSKKQYELEVQQYLISKKNGNLNGNTKARPPKVFKPLIIISAGLDASEYENPQMQRHGINVPTSFYSKFTNDVVKLSKIHHSKVISFLEGGYSDGALTTGIFSHLIGLTNRLNSTKDVRGSSSDTNLWNDSWGSEIVMKELTKGCKVKWGPYKTPKTDITIWANEVIKLGRAMMPNAIIPKNYVYEYKDDTVVENRMTKDLIDPDKHEKFDDTSGRHTRSYFKKLMQQSE